MSKDGRSSAPSKRLEATDLPNRSHDLDQTFLKASLQGLEKQLEAKHATLARMEEVIKQFQLENEKLR